MAKAKTAKKKKSTKQQGTAKASDDGRAQTTKLDPQKVKITAAKGRPMLTWVGKRPLSHVSAFPAQHIETYDPVGQLAAKSIQPELWRDWPGSYPNGGLLFHGDNKEVLGHMLAQGFRNKLNLIYIDPPFDSGVDYVRKVQLRGAGGTAKLDGETYALGEQIQYTDIWANDNYLQFMYERLLLLKELLNDSGVIVLHCDWKKSHHLRCILDEVFGGANFQNEIHWYFYNKMHDDRKGVFPRATNTLLVYAKGDESTFHRVAVPREQTVRQLKRVKVDGVLVNLKDEQGNLVYQDSDTKTLDNVWGIPLIPPADVKQKTNYPTQKPEALVELIVQAYTNPGDLVADMFIGSGTSAAVSQRLGRRWIGCDINKGAIQTTAKRLQGVIAEQIERQEQAARDASEKLPGIEDDTDDVPPSPAQFGFTVWRVNEYDLQTQHIEAVNLACEHIGIERKRSDSYFDGTLGKSLVKIIPLGHPLTPLDLEELKRELDARPDEDRSITLVCLGIELAAVAWVEDWNRLRKTKNAVNKIDVIELRTDPKYGQFIKHEPAKARVNFSRNKNKLIVEVTDFISPTIIERLKQQAGVLTPDVDDWRSMVDCIMIDTAYDGEVFNVALSDVPEKKNDLVEGRYELPASDGNTAVAVKIIDMLGEEVLSVERV